MTAADRSGWSCTCHRFTDSATFRVALGALMPLDPSQVAFDEIGPLYRLAEEDASLPVPGEPTEPPRVPLPGWHVNLALSGRDLPAAWAATRVSPANPSRAWS
ncbi:hypothetical protein C8P66_1489 [Humitalea rosea]|uniref:Uncharacterized protein n=1 Tax=Humitalea rosea TaxID=990373 RepID=A0A2W7HTU0_9PROT|nr:hypothetical protein [Humitalea rosea]PZW36999.1 hypothetical protein C8P66_1489 [Humitalea rosea]